MTSQSTQQVPYCELEIGRFGCKVGVTTGGVGIDCSDI